MRRNDRFVPACGLPFSGQFLRRFLGKLGEQRALLVLPRLHVADNLSKHARRLCDKGPLVQHHALGAHDLGLHGQAMCKLRVLAVVTSRTVSFSIPIGSIAWRKPLPPSSASLTNPILSAL